MNIYDSLKIFQNEILNSSNVSALKNKYHNLCYAIDKDAALDIHNIDFSLYKKDIRNGLDLALNKMENKLYKAVYFEYDIDNNWQTSCFLCSKYNSIKDNDEDWACEFEEDFFISELPECTKIYKKYFLKSFDTLTNLFLIIRTAIVFKEVLSNEFKNYNHQVCIAFHDQSYITRLNEIS